MPRLISTHEDPYRRRFTFPKYNGTVTVLEKPGLMRYLPEFADWSRDMHEITALEYEQAAITARAMHETALSGYLRAYGDGDGRFISGGGRVHWPGQVIASLGDMARRVTALEDTARAHWKAAGRRAPLLFTRAR
jgi:hypothetical protein